MTAVGQLVSPRLTTVFIDQPLLIDSLVHDLATLKTRTGASDASPTFVDPARVLRLVPGETT